MVEFTLYSDFDNKEWLAFDNYMISNISLYMANRFEKGDSGRQSKIYSKIGCREFVDFLNRELVLLPGKKLGISMLKIKFEINHQDIVKKQPKKGKAWSQEFRKWVVLYVEEMGYYVDVRNTLWRLK